MIRKIIFKGYKSFKEENVLELKPITIVFGKNSSGKSSVLRLPTLIEGIKDFKSLRHVNKGVELGADSRDLFYKGVLQEEMNFQIFEENFKTVIQIINSPLKPIITDWAIYKGEELEVETNYNYKKTRLFFDEFSKENEDVIKFKLQTDYLGPFRIRPKRIFYVDDLDDINSFGYEGGKVYKLLAKNEDIEKKVGKWFKDNFDGWELFVNRKNEPYYEIRIRKKEKEEGINIVDVGEGMSQSLPIIVKALNDNDKTPTLNIIEQPELHLHPAAHGNLAELIASSINKSKDKYLIETHSKNFILRLRTLIAKNKLSNDNLNLYFIENDEDSDYSKLKKVNINKSGEVDYWPEGIFEESYEESLELLKAQKENIK